MNSTTDCKRYNIMSFVSAKQFVYGYRKCISVNAKDIKCLKIQIRRRQKPRMIRTTLCVGVWHRKHFTPRKPGLVHFGVPITRQHSMNIYKHYFPRIPTHSQASDIIIIIITIVLLAVIWPDRTRKDRPQSPPRRAGKSRRIWRATNYNIILYIIIIYYYLYHTAYIILCMCVDA